MQIINTTPHDINLILDSQTIVYAKSEHPIRLDEKEEFMFYLDDNLKIKLNQKKYGKAHLPPYKDDQFYIVSLIIAQAFPERSDFIIVNDTVRNEKGQIIGCKSFARV